MQPDDQEKKLLEGPVDLAKLTAYIDYLIELEKKNRLGVK